MERLQAEAWATLGVSTEERISRLKARREGYLDLQRRAPDYFDFNWGLPHGVAAANGLTASLEEMLSIRPLTPLQDPVLQAWLEMVWRYVGVHLPFESDFVRTVLLASAPTGDFNATALSDGPDGAIVVEEGLVRLARRLCALATPLLYRSADNRILVRTKAEIEANLMADEKPAWDIAQLFLDYLTAEEIPLPPPVTEDRALEGRYADTLFQSFIAFVLWHEAFHLEVGAGNPTTLNRGAARADSEKMAAALRQHPPLRSFQWDDAGVHETFVRQREESEADTYAMIRAAAYGSRTGGLPGNVTGAALFMVALETVHRMVTQLADQELFAAELRSGIGDLTAAALIGGRCHPHPRVRRAEVVHVIKTLNPGVGAMVGFEVERAQLVFERVWSLLAASIAVGRGKISAQARRWRAPTAEAAGTMTRALTSLRNP